MNTFNENQHEELEYLEKTLSLIKENLQEEKELLNSKLSSVIAAGREMWEEVSHSSENFDEVPERNHFLNESRIKARDYISTENQIKKLNKLLNSPYFGRFDFIEDDFDDTEKIYVGLSSLIDNETSDILVYDWRAPISSIYYRSELGKCFYKSPAGIVSGNILLKRQYKIKDSKLKYFFDSSIKINDEMLQEVLSQNASDKMKTIVQTIQKEQDIIIRDTENELLIVQGAAGSGKTSIALHRIAFLLYEGLNSKLNTNNVIIVSPNSFFSSYISDVLPELGEDNVEQITFDNIILNSFHKNYVLETRENQMELLLTLQSCSSDDFKTKLDSIKFKGSPEFIKILDNLLIYLERKLIPFKDVYFNGKIIKTGQQIKSIFLNNKINIPAAKRLKRIENMILDKIHPLRKERLEMVEEVVERVTEDHILEIKSFSRLLCIKEAAKLMEYIHTFTEIDHLNLYNLLFKDKNLFLRLSKGITLPENIDEIMKYTKGNLDNEAISYEDAAAILYLKLSIQGNEEFGEIKQVVIDEAQDYYPMHYYLFNLLFKNARYTVLGDYNQTLEKYGNKTIYDCIAQILKKKKTVKLSLNKSYRSSFEINTFNQRLLSNTQEAVPFQRHEAAPEIKFVKDTNELDTAICKDVTKYFDLNYKSIAVICKSSKEALDVKNRLSKYIDATLLEDKDMKKNDSVLVVPSYLAKGLEFDVVLVYDVSNKNYKSDFDKRLLYIACTRALHGLTLYHTGEKSNFIKD